jgi:hypothetical protein
MLTAFSGEETPGVVWRIKLGLRVHISKRRQPAEYTVFYNVDGIVYKDSAVRRSDLLFLDFFVCFCVGVFIICVLVFIVFCIVSFMYIYYCFVCIGVRTTTME